jgi:CheY-like chemotaxis protein
MNTILIVEDNVLDADMLSRRLARRGYTIIVASDGESGCALAAEKMPDLIIMDMGLPVLDGWQATQRIKSSALTAAIPVVALSAHAMSEDRQRGLDAGCDCYETKPLEFDRLIASVEALLKKGISL